MSLKLCMELTPNTTQENNLRSVITTTQWRTLRDNALIKCGNKCEICSGSNRLELHETWQYNDTPILFCDKSANTIVKSKSLIGLIIICADCHAIKHFARTRTVANERNINFNNLIIHFLSINKCSAVSFNKHYKLSIKQQQERSQYQWLPNYRQYRTLISGQPYKDQVLFFGLQMTSTELKSKIQKHIFNNNIPLLEDMTSGIQVQGASLKIDRRKLEIK